MQNAHVIRSRRKTIAIEVRSDGSLVVRAPLRVPATYIDTLLRERAEWITRKQAEISQRQAQSPSHGFQPGETFPYLGAWYPLEHVSRARPLLDLQGSFRLAQAALPNARAVFTRWYQREAETIFADRAALWQAKTGLRAARISLSSARTRWGSCSPSGSINLAWRLVMAPLDAIDYVIVHELAHLKVKNHSRLFWAEVERHFPAYKAQRDWLNKNGHRLTI